MLYQLTFARNTLSCNGNAVKPARTLLDKPFSSTGITMTEAGSTSVHGVRQYCLLFLAGQGPGIGNLEEK